jgi:hypothetical protein
VQLQRETIDEGLRQPIEMTRGPLLVQEESKACTLAKGSRSRLQKPWAMTADSGSFMGSSALSLKVCAVTK